VLQHLRMPLDSVIGFMRDSAAVNGSAINMLGMFTCAVNIMCGSHTLNNVGTHLHFSALASFSSAWVTLMHFHMQLGNSGLISLGKHPRGIALLDGMHWLRCSLRLPHTSLT